MKGARQSSVTSSRPLRSVLQDQPKPSSRERFSSKGPVKTLRPDSRKSSSPDRLRSMSPILSRTRAPERAESPAFVRKTKRQESAGLKTQVTARRTLADLGKVDLKRGNFSNKQILIPGTGSLNVSLADISPAKGSSRTPSPTVSRSAKFQQLSKGFKVTRTALMQGVDSVAQSTKGSSGEV